MHANPDSSWTALLERLAVGLLLLAACLTRVRGIGDPIGDAGEARAASAAQLTLPTAPLGREGLARAARGVEDGPALAAVVLQTWALVAHLTAAGALAWALGYTHGLAAALFALALWGTQPIALLHGTLWGPENLGLACGLVGVGCGLRWAFEQRRASGFGLVLAAGLGSLLGWTSWALIASLGLVPEVRSRARVFAPVLLVTGAATAALQLGSTPETALGSVGRSPLEAFGVPALLVAGIGLGVRLARRGSEQRRERLDAFAVGAAPRADLVAPLLSGGVAAWLLEPGASWVVLTPALAAAGAAAFVQLSRPMLRLRAGLAPVVLAVGLVAVPGLAGFEHMLRQARQVEPAP